MNKVSDTHALRQKVLQSQFNLSEDKHDFDKIQQGTEKSKGWKEINDTAYEEDRKKYEQVLNNNQIPESKAKRQQHLRSCLDNPESLATQ